VESADLKLVLQGQHTMHSSCAAESRRSAFERQGLFRSSAIPLRLAPLATPDPKVEINRASGALSGMDDPHEHRLNHLG